MGHTSPQMDLREVERARVPCTWWDPASGEMSGAEGGVGMGLGRPHRIPCAKHETGVPEGSRQPQGHKELWKLCVLPMSPGI